MKEFILQETVGGVFIIENASIAFKYAKRFCAPKGDAAEFTEALKAVPKMGKIKVTFL